MQQTTPLHAGIGWANTRAWRHLWHTTWGGAVLALLLLLVCFPGKFSLPGLIPVLFFFAFLALLAGALRAPCMAWIFRRTTAMPYARRYWWLLVSTGSLFMLVAVVAAAVFTMVVYPFRAFPKEIWFWIRTFCMISLPWLTAALVAAVYVNYDLLRSPHAP